MSQYAGPRRPPIRRKKDVTPIIMAVLAVMVLPALGFGVYKFVIKKEPLPAALAKPVERNVADTMVNPVERGIAALPKPPVNTPIPSATPALAAARPDIPPPVSSAAADVFGATNAFTNGTTTFDPYASAAASFGSSGRVMSGSHLGAGAAVDKAVKKIKESVELGKTLVIWVVDRSPSCENRRREIAQQLSAVYPSISPSDAAGVKPEDAKLLSVVCSFSNDVKYVTEEPTADVEAVKKALGEIVGEGGTVENTFGAIENVVNKYATFAAPPQSRYISIVVVTDEVGDDQLQRDRVVELTRKNSVPVYVIGQSAAFGSTGQTESSPEGSKGMVTGPESRDVEWVNLEFPGGMAMMNGGGQECGLGPYSLAHLCRESGGEFYAVGGMGASIALPPQYAPRYKSEKDYAAEIGTNKAIAALHAAAKLPPAKQISGPATSFNVDENGLPVIRDIDLGMRPIALIMPGINDLFDTLKKGEGDRAKITEPRLQAAFDLAMGRAMAAKVRAEGYIVLMAAFKAGRKLTNPAGTGWNLNPAVGIEMNSVLDGMAKKSREYLEGVIKNHPNTPWAAAAQQELTQPIGWAWQEF